MKCSRHTWILLDRYESEASSSYYVILVCVDCEIQKEFSSKVDMNSHCLKCSRQKQEDSHCDFDDKCIKCGKYIYSGARTYDVVCHCSIF